MITDPFFYIKEFILQFIYCSLRILWFLPSYAIMFLEVILDE